MKTTVLFYKELTGILAVFPKEKYGFNGYRHDLVTCYSHVGQHSGCAPEYYKKLALAKESDYKDLKQELESEGYNLIVLNETKIKSK